MQVLRSWEPGSLSLTRIGILDSLVMRAAVRVSPAAVFIADPLRFTFERGGIGVLSNSV